MLPSVLARPQLRPATYLRPHKTNLRPGVCWARRSKGQDQGSQQPALPAEDVEILRQYYLASLQQRQQQQPAPPSEAGQGWEGMFPASSPAEAGEEGWEEVPVEQLAGPLLGGKGDAEPEPLATPTQPLQPPPKDVEEAAKQVAEATGKLADTAQQAAEVVAATAKEQEERVNAEAEETQKEVLYTAKTLAQGVQSDAADVADALEETAGDVQSDLTDAAQGMAETAKTALVDAVEGALSQPPPATPAAARAAAAPAVPAAGGGSGPAGGASSASSSSPKGESLSKLKLRLVEVLASLDRGVAATREQRELVDRLCKELQAAGGPVALSWDKTADGEPSTKALLDGRWRLLYSSGFSSGSLGGLRPGPSVSLSPLLLGQVYQDISVERGTLDNVVDLIAKYSLAGLPGINAETPVATARLKHSMQILGSNTVEITFDATSVKLSGGFRGWLDELPSINLPGLQDLVGLPKQARSATFDVVFLDRELRVTRGDRGELRVFVRGGL